MADSYNGSRADVAEGLQNDNKLEVRADQSSDGAGEAVIGTDQRTRVYGTTTYPWRTMGRIDVGCSGTLVGPHHVLTAAHCVYNISNKQWDSNLNFTPAQNGISRPYGTISWSRAITTTGWTVNHDRNFDYAMIILSSPVGNTTGWLGYATTTLCPNMLSLSMDILETSHLVPCGMLIAHWRLYRHIVLTTHVIPRAV